MCTSHWSGARTSCCCSSTTCPTTTCCSGSTVIQHIYDTHFAGAERTHELRARWQRIADLVADDVSARVAERLDEQVRCAEEWRDQVNAYFFRKSGVPDERGREIY